MVAFVYDRHLQKNHSLRLFFNLFDFCSSVLQFMFVGLFVLVSSFFRRFDFSMKASFV